MQKTIVVIALSLFSIAATAQQTGAGKNMVSVTPMGMTQTTPTGFGAQYERFIGNNKWSVTLPVSYSFGHSSPCEPEIRTHMLRAYPGVKFYPAGADHRVAYAIGANAVVGAGNSNCNCGIDELQTATTGAVAENQIVKAERPYRPMKEAGLLLNNSVNIMATKKVFIGSDLGIGGSMIDYNNHNYIDLAFRFNFNIGYRF